MAPSDLIPLAGGESRQLVADKSAASSALRVLYVIDRSDGRVGLTTDDDEEAIYRHLGTDNVRDFRLATAQDVAWIRAMGGHVPKGRIAGTKEAA
jgi:hypothetical protein